MKLQDGTGQHPPPHAHPPIPNSPPAMPLRLLHASTPLFTPHTSTPPYIYAPMPLRLYSPSMRLRLCLPPIHLRLYAPPQVKRMKLQDSPGLKPAQVRAEERERERVGESEGGREGGRERPARALDQKTSRQCRENAKRQGGARGTERCRGRMEETQKTLLIILNNYNIYAITTTITNIRKGVI